MRRSSFAIVLLAAGLAAGAWPAGAAMPAIGDPPAVPDWPDSISVRLPEPVPADRRVGGGPVDYLWVPRTALVERGSPDSVIARARAMGVRGLLVQVVGRGDAYYRSAILPRAEALGPGSPDDPLAEIVAGAARAGLEVHAWMNCMLVWSAPRAPRDPRHVLHTHPEWIGALSDGRRLTRLGPRERRRLGLEGVFLAPAHPGVGPWLASIAAEIASRYAVDGIHLDYVREPSVAVGGDPTTRARFALGAGVDPARPPGAGPGRAAFDSAWVAFRRSAVTAVVRQVRDTLRAVRPGVALSAAVLSDPPLAERTCAQDWRAWLAEGLVDRAFPMAYAPSVQTVLDQLVAHRQAVANPERIVPGIAVYNTSPAVAAHKINGAKALGFPAVALYAYDSLFDRPSRWPALAGLLAGLKAGAGAAENRVQALPDSAATP